MSWPDNPQYKDIDLLHNMLNWSSEKGPIACRGQADKDWLLQTSIDRLLDPKADYMARLAEERATLEKFRVLAREYLGMAEKMYLDGSYPRDSVGALTVLQHYRAPTRLLDWTESPWVALYFATIDHHDKDGAIWWFKHQAFYDGVHAAWDNIYHMKRYPPLNEVNLDDTAFSSDGPEWISPLFCRVPFHRIEVQQGFFTVAGRLGYEHSALIEDVLKKEEYGRIIVPKQLKQQILDRLRIMNIHSKSLDYPGADFVGKELTRELKNAQQRTPVVH